MIQRGSPIKLGWVCDIIPSYPQKLNFYQYLSIRDFYVGYLLFEKFLPIVCKLQ